MRAPRLAAGTVAAFTSLATPGLGQTLVEANDPYRMLMLLRDAGYSVQLSTDSVGDPLLVADIAGLAVDVFFYDCTDNRACRTLQFSVGFDLPDGMSLESANAWNQAQRYGKVYLDEEFDPFLQMDVNVDYGVSEANFVDQFLMWSQVLEEFTSYIDWYEPGTRL